MAKNNPHTGFLVLPQTLFTALRYQGVCDAQAIELIELWYKLGVFNSN